MRLLDLTALNFRGFGSSGVPIPLDADLVLMFGANGFGKTSLAEAIEWLLYGTTRRRQRGEDYSKAEYDGCFSNVHGGQPTEVSARVRLADGSERIIARRIPAGRPDTESEFFVDGVRSALSTLGLSIAGEAHPVIAQHDLQSFIHSRPKERRDAICRALGLDELTSLKSALDSARRSFALSPPSAVTEARVELKRLAPGLSSIPELQEVAQRWHRTPVEVHAEHDLSHLLGAARRLSGSSASDPTAVLAELRAHRQRLSSTVFDSAVLVPRDETAHSTLAAAVARTNTSCAAVAGKLAASIASRASVYSAALLQLWELGLKLSPSGDLCPMCEQPTLTEAQRNVIRTRLASSADTVAKDRALRAAVADAEAALVGAQQAAKNAAIVGLSTENRTRLASLVGEDSPVVQSFLLTHDAVIEARIALVSEEINLLQLLHQIASGLANMAKAGELLEGIANIPRRYADRATTFSSATSAYDMAWREFEKALTAQISTNAAIAEVDAVGKAVRAEPHIRTLAAYDSVLDESLHLMRRVEAHLQERQNQLLVASSQRVKQIYDQMNPGASVTFEAMETGTDQLKLHAKSFGVRMSAAANLSECQLNCLGLAFWLARATAQGSPFIFILLDDPVQSMDDDHCEAFIASVVPWLCDQEQRQVLVLSHERRLIDRLRDLNKSRDLAVLHFDQYDLSGP